MRQHKIIQVRILLILLIASQIANFVFGAPVAVRGTLEGYINADETEDDTAALQKRVKVEEGSTNMAGQTSPRSDRTKADRLWQEMGQLGMDVRPRFMFPLSQGSDPAHQGGDPVPVTDLFPPFRPFRPVSIASTSLPNSPIRIFGPVPPHVPLTHPVPFISPPPQAEGHLHPASSVTGNPSTTGHQLTPQQNSGPDLDTHPPLNPEPHPLPNPEQPSPNPVQPTPNQEPHSLPNPESHPSTSSDAAEVLDILRNGRIKRTFPAPVQ